jgi:inhibitor of KinA
MASLFERPMYRLMGDRAFLVELGDGISPAVNQRVRALFLELERLGLEGVRELIPSYRSLLAIYDPLTATLSTLKRHIEKAWERLDHASLPSPKTMRVPVVYGGECGPDLDWVAGHHGITPEEVIRLHTQPTYQVYLIGFTPGYPYMGELPDALVTPRRDTPRAKVPRGSVGIAQKQTGIYPVASPGGWQIIGRTPLALFDPKRRPPSALEMGDLVQFYAITAQEMAQWEG